MTVAPDRPPPDRPPHGEPPHGAGAARQSPLGRALRVLGILAAVAFVALLAYGLTTKSADRTIDDALSRGEAVAPPGFELARLADGSPSGPAAAAWRRASGDGEVALDELRGTPVVLNFWASWCEPCRAEAEVLQQGFQDARGEVLFLGLDAQDASEDARDFISQFGLTFPHVRDPSNATSRDWGVTGLPETFFLAADGLVVGHVIGSVSEQQLSEGVAAARAGRPRDAAQGGEQRPTRDAP